MKKVQSSTLSALLILSAGGTTLVSADEPSTEPTPTLVDNPEPTPDSSTDPSQEAKAGLSESRAEQSEPVEAIASHPNPGKSVALTPPSSEEGTQETPESDHEIPVNYGLSEALDSGSQETQEGPHKLYDVIVNQSISRDVTDVVFGRLADYQDVIEGVEGTNLSYDLDTIKGYKVGTTYYILSDGDIVSYDMTGMFKGKTYLETVTFENFDASNVTSMKELFKDCAHLKSVDMSGINSGSVTDMSGMFENCYKLWTIVLPDDTSNVTTMNSMFKNNYQLHNLDVSGMDTGLVNDFSSMFQK